MHLRSAALLLLLVIGCAAAEQADSHGAETDPTKPVADADGDGFSAGDGTSLQDDCDDEDPNVHPGASEWCNGVDDDCNGVVDGTDAQDAPRWYHDADADGYGAPDGSTLACEAPAGWSALGTDCDDTNAAIHPGAEELCLDRTDNDCDGTVDGGDCPVCTTILPDDGTDLQAAVDAAGAGDSVCLRAGTWVGDVRVTDDVRVAGLDGRDVTVIEGSVDFYNATNQVLSGVTITGGTMACLGAELTTLTVDDVTLERCSGETAGGLRAEYATVTLTDVDVRECGSNVGSGAGGIAASASDIVADRLTVADNLGGVGGISTTSGTLSLTDSTVDGNVGMAGPGGIDVYGADLTVDGVEVTANDSTATRGAGICVRQGSITGTRLGVRDNTMGSGTGAGIYATISTIDLVGLQLVGNSNQGGGVALQLTSSEATVSQAVIAENRATLGSGGGISIADSTLSLDHALIADNLLAEAGKGAGHYVSSGDVSLAYTILAGNTIYGEANGGGLWIGGDVRMSHSAVVANLLVCAVCSGGAVGVGDAGAVELVDSIISDAPAGYGIVVESGGAPEVSTTDVANNAAGGWSGMADPTGTDGNVAVDPELLDLTAVSPLDWDFHVSGTSAVIGIASDTNPDGSPGTLGPFGGPEADRWDLDQDGFPAWWHAGPYDSAADPTAGWDCDDLDATVYPGAGC